MSYDSDMPGTEINNFYKYDDVLASYKSLFGSSKSPEKESLLHI